MHRLILAFVLIVTVGLSAQQNRGPSTPEERKRAVEIAAALEKDPISPTLEEDRKWLVRWLIEVPDITISLCGASFPYDKGFKYGPDLIAVASASSAAYVIEHASEAQDTSKVGYAALQSVLRAYRAIVAQHPEARSKDLDEAIAQEEKGKLQEYHARLEKKKGCK